MPGDHAGFPLRLFFSKNNAAPFCLAVNFRGINAPFSPLYSTFDLQAGGRILHFPTKKSKNYENPYQITAQPSMLSAQNPFRSGLLR